MVLSLVIYSKNELRREPSLLSVGISVCCEFVKNRVKSEVRNWYNYKKYLWFCKIDIIYSAIENFLRAIFSVFDRIGEKETAVVV